MLRVSDLLLTLAAVFLLNAALKSGAKSNRFTLASASQVMQPQPSDMDRELYATSDRPGDQMQSFDHWMSKIRRNLKQSEQEARPDSAKNETSAGQQQQQQQQRDAQQVSQYRQALEVKVDFLRTNPAPSEAANSLRGAQNTSTSSSSTTNTLYLLNYLLPHLKTSRSDQASTTALPEVSSNELFDSSEQQQPPPFTLFPQVQQPAGGLPNQFQQQLQQQLQQQQPAIRQMLSNYQRYPQSRPMSDHQRQLLTQLQPRPPELHLRPPTQAPALGLGNPNTQQPLSPLQLLAGPFQAFLPGLAGQQPQAASPNSHVQQQQQQQQQSAKAKHEGGEEDAAKAPVASPAPQQPNPFTAFLNPFNLQPPPQAANVNGAQQQPAAGQPGIANLQSFYQQLPLYQALMAARQRQEALQAAQKMREQQQQQTNGNQLTNQPYGLGQPGLTQPISDNNGATPPPFARLPPGAFGLPAQTPANQNQLTPNALGQNPWTPQLQPQQPAPPYSQPPLQPPIVNQLPQTPATQPMHPTNNHNGPVQFDDEQPVNQLPQQPIPQQPTQQPPAQENPGHEQDNGHQNNDNNDNNNQHQNDGNQGDDNQNHGNNQDPGGQEQDNQGGRPAEEEDPDLKSFQNLANGGDSFTDLFPKGILSDGDINEIKTQQAEQAKKQEEEERQRHLRQQQQQQQHHHQQQQQQQQYNNQPVNQFAGNNIDNGNYQNGQQPNSNQQQVHNDNSQEQPDQGGGNQEENEQQDDGNQGDGEGGGGGGDGEGDGQEEDSPTAAALTAKSASNEKLNGRWTKSPGVEYARE